MSDDLTTASAARLSELLASGQISSVEVTQAHLDRIAAVDGDIHAFLHINLDWYPKILQHFGHV